MRLEALAAAPHPDGYRVELTWANPRPADWPGVRVVRREGTWPADPGDGVVVAEGTGLAHAVDDAGRALHRVADTGLRGGRVYYYAVFPFRGAPAEWDLDRANRTASLAAARHGSPERMYDLLPALYRRYDRGAEALRRFLEIPGGQLDLLHAYAAALLDAHDPARVDGRLLPLLAEWIGWKTDHGLELDRQRGEVRDAPAVYRRVGTIPVVESTVKRISGWEARSKEFVHNVARSNQPPRLNLWARGLDAGGAPDGPETLLSLDYAYEGRPAFATDDLGVRWLFYHTRRLGRWRVWAKSSPTLLLPPEAAGPLGAADAAGLQPHFAAAGADLAADAVVTAAGSRWEVDDATSGERWVVEPAGGGFTVYHVTADPLAWAPSRPLGGGDAADEKHPAAALQGGTLWVFASAYDAAAGRWEIRYRTRSDGAWSPRWTPFTHGSGGAAVERRAPAAVVDGAGALWLFWLERAPGGRWLLRYNHRPGPPADPPDPDAWTLDPPGDFPRDGGADPRVEEEPSVLFHPGEPNRPLWVLWSRREPGPAPGQTRWTVALRAKGGADPTVDDWGPVRTLPRPAPAVNDREPAAVVDAGGDLRLFWSSDRGGGRGVWRATLALAPDPPVWGAAAALTPPPYAGRAPLPLPAAAGGVLLYRSDRSVEYASGVYGATATVDFRYAGSITPHARDAARLDLRGAFGDLGGYTFDSGRTNDDRYRRDTLGLFLAPDTLDPEAVERGRERLAAVVPEFLPATDRAVLVTSAELHADFAYTYDRPGAAEPRFIGETHADLLTVPLPLVVIPPGEDFQDDLE
ncbi:MAG TPA: phage tail protein [Longimicrobiaceae bacterium]|nr:phage tail protein [Longimicrobiaceae bacterium]